MSLFAAVLHWSVCPCFFVHFNSPTSSQWLQKILHQRSEYLSMIGCKSSSRQRGMKSKPMLITSRNQLTALWRILVSQRHASLWLTGSSQRLVSPRLGRKPFNPGITLWIFVLGNEKWWNCKEVLVQVVRLHHPPTIRDFEDAYHFHSITYNARSFSLCRWWGNLGRIILQSAQTGYHKCVWWRESIWASNVRVNNWTHFNTISFIVLWVDTSNHRDKIRLLRFTKRTISHCIWGHEFMSNGIAPGS